MTLNLSKKMFAKILDLEKAGYGQEKMDAFMAHINEGKDLDFGVTVKRDEKGLLVIERDDKVRDILIQVRVE